MKRDIHQAKIIEAAKQRGIHVEDYLLQGHDLIRLEKSGKHEWVLKGRVFGSLSLLASHVADNKVLMKEILNRLKVPVPAQLVFKSDKPDMKAISNFIKKHSQGVIKPVVGSNGEGVQTGIYSARQVISYLKLLDEPCEMMLEEYAAGEDLRIQVLEGKIIAACKRIPCTVVADGSSSIRNLIEQRNALITKQNPDNYIQIDAQVHALLKEQSCSLDDVPAEGQEIRIKQVANMSQGAHAVDITEVLHPRYQDIASAIATELEISLFSLDAISDDPGADPIEEALFLEINPRPAWLHHTFSERRTHDIPGMIIDSLFK